MPLKLRNRTNLYKIMKSIIMQFSNKIINNNEGLVITNFLTLS